MRRAVVGLFLLISTSAMAADLPPRTKEYSRCIEKAGAVDPAVLECISAEYDRQDKRLNAAYRKLMGSLKGERKKTAAGGPAPVGQVYRSQLCVLLRSRWRDYGPDAGCRMWRHGAH